MCIPWGPQQCARGRLGTSPTSGHVEKYSINVFSSKCNINNGTANRSQPKQWLGAPERTWGSDSLCREAVHSPRALNLDTFYHAAQVALGAPYNFIVSSCNNTGKWNNNVKLALIKMKGVCLSLLLLLSRGCLLSYMEHSKE